MPFMRMESNENFVPFIAVPVGNNNPRPCYSWRRAPSIKKAEPLSYASPSDNVGAYIKHIWCG